MVIKIKNLNKLIKKFDKAGQVDVYPVIKEAGAKVQRSAKKLAPVDKGVLRASIKRKSFKKRLSAIVYTTTEYGPYQEFGTRKMKAQPFMQPGLKENEQDISDSMEKHIKSELKKLKK